MKPIYLTVGEGLPLVIIPDTEAHLDGHPVVTRTYSIYVNYLQGLEGLVAKENELHLQKKTDSTYRGEIVFEIPGRVFKYIAEGARLNPFEIQELVEKLSHHRDNPELWSLQ